MGVVCVQCIHESYFVDASTNYLLNVYYVWYLTNQSLFVYNSSKRVGETADQIQSICKTLSNLQNNNTKTIEPTKYLGDIDNGEMAPLVRYIFNNSYIYYIIVFNGIHLIFKPKICSNKLHVHI